jgi:alkaline phosphatase
MAAALGLVLAIATPASLARQAGPEEASWQRAQAELARRIEAAQRPQQARNVILFIADGMSIPTISAARIFEGERAGDGEAHTLSFDAFPATALVRTYNADAQVADSASTATALVTGHKTRSGAISVTADQFLDACAADAEFPATLAERAEDQGLATGIVSTARLTHATPATMYAHSLIRYWEADSDIAPEGVEAGCVDIAAQLLAFASGDGIDVALGGGREKFLPQGEGGERGDGRNLIAEWQGRGGVAVTDAAGFRSLDAAADAPVLGLFNDSHMAFEADRDDAAEPSLAEMTAFAIDRLSRDEDGYVLMVEAGRVDHAHHATNAYRAMTDMQAFDAAIATALERVDLDETLVVVTADHGHTMTFAGYPSRGNPILGLVRRANPYEPGSEPELTLDETGRPYTTLGYRNGPNVRPNEGGALDEATVLDPDYRQETAVALSSETHSGADVALYAAGPRAHWFGGSIEQNTVFHLMAAALGWTAAGDGDATSQDE